MRASVLTAGGAAAPAAPVCVTAADEAAGAVARLIEAVP